MKILYLNTTYQCGGAEQVVSQLKRGMERRGHEVHQIVSYDTRNLKLPPMFMCFTIPSGCGCSTG